MKINIETSRKKNQDRIKGNNEKSAANLDIYTFLCMYIYIYQELYH